MKYLFFTLMMFFCTNLFAQTTNEKLEELQHRYISKNLKLDEKTSKEFWPLYDEYKAKRREIAKEFRNNGNEESAAFDKLEREQKMLDLRKEYTNRFSKVLNGQQLEELNSSERNFKQMLIRRSERKQLENSNPHRRYESAPLERKDLRHQQQQAPSRIEPSRLPSRTSVPSSVSPSRSTSPRNSSPAKR